MQCPACKYEPTMAEQSKSPDACVACGIYYAKFQARQPATKPSEQPERSGGLTGARAAVKAGRAERERIERTKQERRATPLVVSVVDLDIPFGTMVTLLVKLALAMIPAALILAVIVYGTISILSLF